MILSKKYDQLLALLPLLKEFRYNKSCCKTARKRALIVSLKDIFAFIEYKINDEDLKNNPTKYYDLLKEIISTDRTLNVRQRLNLKKLF